MSGASRPIERVAWRPSGGESAREWASAWAPAGVGNLAAGFDILGHSIAGLRDTARVRRIEASEVRIAAIHGCVADLPFDAAANTAGRALMSLRAAQRLPFGFEIELTKGIPLGSGLGGSAASCVAALVAANALLDAPLSRQELYAFALDGEAAASGCRHGDNVAAMLLGGLVLATPDRVLPLAVPDWLYCVVAHPAQVLTTRQARAVLSEPYPLAAFVRQSGHLALLLTGLARADADLIRAGLKDVLIEPRRAPLIPGFDAVKRAALDHDALGAGISGAGPSVFSWFPSRAQAQAAAPAMVAAFAASSVTATSYFSPVRGPRAELLADDEASA